MAQLFREGPRTDPTARSFHESLHAFMDRSGDPFFGEIRRLMTSWLGHVPSRHVADLRRRLQSKDDAQFESAFWELYLHEAYLSSGCQLTIHPAVAGTGHHPDFLIESDDARFYLEAVRACAPADRTGQNKRLEEARRVLAAVGADRYILDMATYAVGTRPLSVKVLRRALRDWLSELDEEAGRRPAGPGSGDLARLEWRHEDWRLAFTAQPVRLDDAPGGHPLIRTYLSMGWAYDTSRILAALDDKANRYGALDAPLVIAVLCNTEFHTDDADVECALFGATLDRRPGPEPLRPGQLLAPGHWRTSNGWRRAHSPQVIAAQNLYPWTVAAAQPRLWTTLETGISAPAQPGWLARVQVTGPAPVPGPADSPAELFKLPADWLAEGPHFATQPRTAAL